jgi:hypothetical protein
MIMQLGHVLDPLFKVMTTYQQVSKLDNTCRLERDSIKTRVSIFPYTVQQQKKALHCLILYNIHKAC